MRKTIITLVVALASLVPVGVWGDGMPPTSEKGAAPGTPAAPGAPSEARSRLTSADLRGDAPGEYTVQKGDTLWGIAGRFLKDPWRWPEIWNMNKDQIKNPHLIYPGDVIRLDRTGLSPSLSLSPGGTGPEAAVANVVRLEPRMRVLPLAAAVPSIPGSAIGPFLTQPLVVEEDGLNSAPSIVATEDSRVIVGAGDIAYADRIAQSDTVNWQVFRPGTPLRDPDTNEILGYEAKYLGDARVRRFGNPTTLEILKTRQEINRGDRLLPAREVGLPNYVPHAPDRPIRGAIMSVDGGVSELGQFQVVALNRGSRDGITVGTVLAAYRRGALVTAGGKTIGDPLGSVDWFRGMEVKPNPIVPDTLVAQADPKAPAPVAVSESGRIQLPDERTGLVFVFRVFEKMSYAMVMRATKPIYVGDIVRTP